MALLRARPEVKSVLDYANTGDPTMISKDGKLTVVVATVGAVQEQKAVTALQSAIAAHPSLKGNVWLGGPTVADVQIAAVSSQDLGRAELFALPFLILLLFFVFRGLRAAAIPLIGAVFAIAVTSGVMGLVMVVMPLSVFALNLVIALGLGLAVDFSLLMVSRFREEYAGRARWKRLWPQSGAPPDTPCCSARSPSRRQWLPLPSSPSASSTRWESPERSSCLAAGAFALFVLPSLLIASVSALRHAPDVDASQAMRDEASDDGTLVPGRHRVMRRPAIWALSAVIVLVVLAAPFLHVSFTGADASSLPASSSAGAAYQLVQTKFADFSEAPAGLVVDAARATPRSLAQLPLRHRGSRRKGCLGLPAPRRVSLGVRTWRSRPRRCRRPRNEPSKDLQSLPARDR